MHQTPLQASRQLALARAHETAHGALQTESQTRAPTLLTDAFAQQLVAAADEKLQGNAEADPLDELMNLLATRYTDDTLQSALAATSMNTINKGDYRQVVLVGDGMDTRPFRLTWPEGTLIFVVAPREVHELAAATLKAEGAHVPRGSLLRRVPATWGGPQEPVSFLAALEGTGFQGNKLSIWVLQGFAGQGLSDVAVRQLLSDVTDGAAFNSLVLGEVPTVMGKQEAVSLLAEFGLLSTVLNIGGEVTGYGRWAEEDSKALAARSSSSGDAHRRLFASQVMRLSLAQMGIYSSHSAAAMDVDEDFEGSFS